MYIASSKCNAKSDYVNEKLRFHFRIFATDKEKVYSIEENEVYNTLVLALKYSTE